jgi:hypothetical protein
VNCEARLSFFSTSCLKDGFAFVLSPLPCCFLVLHPRFACLLSLYFFPDLITETGQRSRFLCGEPFELRIKTLSLSFWR